MIARLAITAAILTYLATRIDMGAAVTATAAISPPHLMIVLAMVAVDRGVMILRWILLLRASGINITAADATRLFLVGSFVGSFLPAGIGADAARAYGLTRGTASTAPGTPSEARGTRHEAPPPGTPSEARGTRHEAPRTSHEARGTRHEAPLATASEALASVAVDRLLGVASLVLMSIIGVIATPDDLGDWRVPMAIAVALIACVAVFWANEWLRLLLPTHRQGGFIARRALRLTEAVGRYRDRRGVLVHVLAWSIVVQVLRISQAYILAVGLGMAVPYSYFLLFMPLGLLLLLLPISISGFGAPQAGIVWLLRPTGVADSDAFALSTLIVLTGLAGNLPGLFLWLRARNPVKSST